MERTSSISQEGRCIGLFGFRVTGDLVEVDRENILRSQKIDPFDVTEAAVYLAISGKHAVVHQIVIDRLGAVW